jgi:hypothetical protein
MLHHACHGIVVATAFEESLKVTSGTPEKA